jgi:AraC-like DNA-binding protein
VELARERGVDPLPLLGAAAIEPGALEDPAARVPLSKEFAFVRALLERTGDPALGLEAGRGYHLAVFGLLGAMVGAAPTLREVVRLFLQYLELTYTPFAVVLDEAGERSRLSFTDDVQLGPLRRFYLDRDVCFALEVVRTLWPDGPERYLRRVDFDYPAPAEGARYRALAPCPVTFDAALAGISFDLSADAPRAQGSALALRFLEEQLRAGFSPGAGGDDVVARVRRSIAASVATRGVRPAAAAVAESFGLAERTLRRRLAAARTSYRALEQDVLMQLASRQLERPGVSLSSVAERLGYAEAASFARAFRRWSGRTPRGR